MKPYFTDLKLNQAQGEPAIHKILGFVDGDPTELVSRGPRFI